MDVFENIGAWREERRSFPNHISVGFVPTMGNLHRGHASLYEASLRENQCTIASIYVNRTQFNVASDYDLYPRTLDADLTFLENLGVHYCLVPTEKEIYVDNYCYQLLENQQHQQMEGLHRPQHFTGVLTVVMKLLHLANPHRAYFGEKDYQQYMLIKNMVAAFFMDIEIKSCPTIRETSGLACSSRNNRLTAEERQVADQSAKIFIQKSYSIQQLKTQLSTLDIDIEYLEEHKGRRFIAINIGKTRLIDNYALY